MQSVRLYQVFLKGIGIANTVRICLREEILIRVTPTWMQLEGFQCLILEKIPVDAFVLSKTWKESLLDVSYVGEDPSLSC